MLDLGKTYVPGYDPGALDVLSTTDYSIPHGASGDGVSSLYNSNQTSTNQNSYDPYTIDFSLFR